MSTIYLHHDKDWLENQYINLKKSACTIAKDLGRSSGTIYKWLKKHSIPRRSLSEAAKNDDRTGENNPFWRGGKNVSQGYIFIRKPNHPNHHNSYVRDHILVMEEHIGRHLKPDERVHHINYDKKDNRIENLWLTNNRSHSKADATIRKLIKPLLERGIIKFDRNGGFYKIADI